MDQFQITKEEFTSLLQLVLKDNYAKEVLTGTIKKKRFDITPEFTADSAQLSDFPLSQLLVYGYGRTNSASNTLLHSHASLDKQVAVVGHACDVRAMVELVKKLQVNLENVFNITCEDQGFLEVKVLNKFFKAEKINDADITYERLTPTHFIIKLKDGTVKKFPLGDKLNVAKNCQRCVQKSHPLADFMIGTYGLPDDSEDYVLTAQSERAKAIIKKMGWEKKAISDSQAKAYSDEAKSIISACQAKRDEDLAAWKENPNKLQEFAKCTACGLCVTSCPVCFCVTCNLLDNVKAKKSDKVNFIMTRFAHVGDTCVECGRCESSCPMNIPLTTVFQTLRDKFMARRKYESGAAVDQTVMHLDV